MRQRTKTTLIAGITLALLATPTGPAPAEEEPALNPPGCAEDAEGGEWRSYGGDLQNTRSQPDEDVIDAANAQDLSPAFVFDVNDHGHGIVHTTPTVADGCVYFGTTGGWVFALNADTGELVWETQLPVQDSGLLCTGVIGSPAVSDGRVFAIVSQAHEPYIVALDQQDGSVLWQEVIEDEVPYIYNCASPVVFDAMVIAPFTGDQTQGHNRGGYAIFDVETGELLAHSYTIPDDDYPTYQGGGIWSTPGIDEVNRYAYVGTSNPEAGGPEHERTNAIVKIDLDPGRETFGEIVDSYKGDPDRYLPIPAPPTCDPDPAINVFVRSIACLQMDIDFGASPQIFTDGDRTTVGNLQKSGAYHAFDGDTMQREWRTVVAPPTFYTSGATAAMDPETSSIFVAGSPPGQMVSLDAHSGLYQWVSPIADLIHFQANAYANGLVFTNDAKGVLNIYDADTGRLVAMHHIWQDAGFSAFAQASSGSASVARNTVYVGTAEFLIAYQL